MTITARFILRAATACVALSLTACGGNACDRPEPFQAARERGAMRVPDDLSPPESSGKYELPDAGAGKPVRGPCADAPPLQSVAAAARAPAKAPARGAALSAPPPSNAATTVAPGMAAGGTRGSAVPAGDLQRDVAATVAAWLEAWRNADAERYLAFYSAGFEPPVTGERLDVWRAKRAALLRDSGPVDVRQDRLTISATAAGATARFIQEFHDGGQISAVVKELDLVAEDGRWRIVRERVADVL